MSARSPTRLARSPLSLSVTRSLFHGFNLSTFCFHNLNSWCLWSTKEGFHKVRKFSPNVPKLSPHVRKKELKKTKKKSKWIEKRNDWDCCGTFRTKRTGVRLFRAWVPFSTQKTKKNVKMDWKTKRFGLLRDIWNQNEPLQENASLNEAMCVWICWQEKTLRKIKRNNMQKRRTQNQHFSEFIVGGKHSAVR